MAERMDYSVDVCDGSCWKLKIRHSNNKVQKLSGTVEYPPHGKHIECELLRLCEEAGGINPLLFGCRYAEMQMHATVTNIRNCCSERAKTVEKRKMDVFYEKCILCHEIHCLSLAFVRPVEYNRKSIAMP